jgi:hypothetical protein
MKVHFCCRKMLHKCLPKYKSESNIKAGYSLWTFDDLAQAVLITFSPVSPGLKVTLLLSQTPINCLL